MSGELEYAAAAKRARIALYSAVQPPRETLEALSRAALALAPDDERAGQWRRILTALGDGHRFAVKTYAAVVAVDGEDALLIADIESAFEQGDET